MRPDWHAKAIALYDQGFATYATLGQRFGVTRFAVYRAVNKSATARGVQKTAPKDRRLYMREYMRKRRASAA